MPTAPPSAEEDAVGGQADETEERTVAQGLDADDEIADRPADNGAPEEEGEPEGRLAVVPEVDRIGEDAEQHPAEQSAQGAENGVEINAREKGHRCRPCKKTSYGL